jgi:uncharacterized protein (TIGR02466 family)
MDYKSWFFTPIGVDFITEVDNDQLRNYCLNLRNTSDGRTVSNAGGWQSKELDFNIPEIQDLLQAIWIRLLQMKDDIGIKDQVDLVIQNIWINVNNKGDFNRPHVHPTSAISGVYYVDADPKSSGDIVFINPVATHTYHWNKEWFKEDKDEISSATAYYKPTTTQLILFPSWICHYVEPSNCDAPRISIAFNAGIKNGRN